MRVNFTIALSLILLAPRAVISGIDKFSIIDRIGGWEIERKINSKNQSIKCRASLPSYYQWFSGKVRITSTGKLIIPDEFNRSIETNPKTIEKIRKAISHCNSNLIYRLTTLEK